MLETYIMPTITKPPINRLEVEKPEVKFDPAIAGIALAKGLVYLQKQLGWSRTKIAKILNLAPNTVNHWLNKGEIPIRATNPKKLSPDIQAIVHLLAIHRSLSVIFNNSKLQQAWLTTFSPDLNAIPEELMGESIEKLIYVRNYLDDARERGF